MRWNEDIIMSRSKNRRKDLTISWKEDNVVGAKVWAHCHGKRIALTTTGNYVFKKRNIIARLKDGIVRGVIPYTENWYEEEQIRNNYD